MGWMPAALPVAGLSIYSLAIPMRVKFKHALAERVGAEPIIVRLELANHVVGHGEAQPRTYVTGESHADVLQTIQDVFVPILLELRPTCFGDAIEAAANLPVTSPDGRPITAARAAVEIALLDAYSRAFDRSFASVAGYLEESRIGSPGSTAMARFGIIISSMDPRKIKSFVTRMRLARIRYFKLKVGDADDDARLKATVRALGRKLTADKIVLAVDANAAWTLDEATEKLRAWEHLPIAYVEQPLAKDAGKDWGQLARRTSLPLMPDESLVTPDDAEAMIVQQAAGWFNIRIAKNGGLLPALQLAVLARRHGIAVRLGCMVGETSILSAAGRWFLQSVPDVRFAEGNFGKFLLKDDVVARPLRFSFGGRWRPMTGPGLGIEVDPARLERLALTAPIHVPF